MTKPKILVAVGICAMLGTAAMQLVQVTFIKPPLVNAAVEGLFVGAVVYLGAKTFERSAETQ